MMEMENLPILMDDIELLAPLELFGRQAQFQQITQALTQDRDLLIAGVPGSGRRTLVRRAAQAIDAKILEVDCIRATNSQRFLQLICEGMTQTFKSEASLKIVEEWLTKEASSLFVPTEYARFKPRLLSDSEQWLAFKLLLQLPQQVAQTLNRQIAIILQGFPHIRSWDRQGKWEAYLRAEIESQTQVSYVLIATIAEISYSRELPSNNLETIELAPLSNDIVAAWVQEVLRREGLSFDPRSQSLSLFLEAVQGHLGDASKLVGRLRLLKLENGLIGETEIEQTIQELLSDLATTFETLLMLLPPNQAHLLESLAIDPTYKPQSLDYINKHYLSRGGSLQGALLGLQNKGLIYGAELGYKIALPLLASWLRQRLR